MPKVRQTVIGVVLGASVLCVSTLIGFRCNAARLESQKANSPTAASFEVASVKPDHSGTGVRTFKLSDPTMFRATNVSTKKLIEFAYHVLPFQVSGGPKWIDSQMYDVDARVNDATVARLQKLPPQERIDQIRAMVQSLLAGRFKLTISRENKSLRVFVLVISKRGSHLVSTTSPLDPTFSGDMTVYPGNIIGKGLPVRALAEALADQPEIDGRLVLNETGLSGRYDFTLKWATPRNLDTPGESANDRSDGKVSDSSGPSLFSAIQDQLGLKIETRNRPVEVLSINRVEKPSEN